LDFNSPLDFHQKIRGGGTIRPKMGVSIPAAHPLINEGELLQMQNKKETVTNSPSSRGGGTIRPKMVVSYLRHTRHCSSLFRKKFFPVTSDFIY